MSVPTLQVKIHCSLPKHKIIVPFFIPFRGCPGRCIYCAQDAITRCPNLDFALEVEFTKLTNVLIQRQQAHLPKPELAFYGGTFTALAEAEFQACIDLSSSLYTRGLISTVRCSTRPDCLSKNRLAKLTLAHFSTIELGIQSFADKALKICQRAYTREQAISACQKVSNANFNLGVQLMPGLPGFNATTFLEDVALAIELGAKYLRFYPCLVFKNTYLASLFNTQSYTPWDLETTISNLAQGLLLATKANVEVIRMGLPAQMDFTKILAGPWTHDLGARVQAQALYLQVCEVMTKYKATQIEHLYLPKHLQGFFWGHKKELVTAWHTLALTPKNLTFGDFKDGLVVLRSIS